MAGLQFRLPTQEHLHNRGAKAKLQSLDDGSVGLTLTSIESDTESSKFGSIIEWKLKPDAALLPTSFRMTKFHGDPEVEEDRVVVQSGTFRLKSHQDCWYVDELEMDFFNNIENKETGIFEHTKVRSDIYRVLEIQEVDPEKLAFTKPPGAVGVATASGELELTPAIKSQINAIGNELPSNSRFITYLIILIVCVFFAAIAIVQAILGAGWQLAGD